MKIDLSYRYINYTSSYGKTVKIVHFIGAIKPWHHSFNLNSGEVEPLPDAGTFLMYMYFVQKNALSIIRK